MTCRHLKRDYTEPGRPLYCDRGSDVSESFCFCTPDDCVNYEEPEDECINYEKAETFGELKDE